MAGIITTGNHPKALWPGVHAWFGAVYDQYPAEYSQIFEVKQSTQNYEEMVKLTDFGLAPVKDETTGIHYTSNSQSYVKRFTHVVYGQGFIVSEEELEDNLYAQVATDRAEALAFSLRETVETVHGNIVNRAFNSAYPGGDGKELIATDHPVLNGTYSNELATPADLDETSLEDLMFLIMKATSENGHNISLMARCLIVPPDLFYEANRIYTSDLQNDTNLNARNVLLSTGAFPEGIKVMHKLTDTDAYFIKTNCPKGLTTFMRRAPRLKKDSDFDTGNAKAKSDIRFSTGWADPMTIFGSAGV